MSENTTPPTPDTPDMGFPPGAGTRTPWSEAEAGLVAARTYWLSTVRPNGKPHVMPVWGIWLNQRFYLSTSPTSRKGRNLAANPRCVISVSRHTLDIVVEGTASLLTDEATATAVAELYGPKYDWLVTQRDCGLYDAHGEGGPLYVLEPEVAFGFGDGEEFTATRWRF